MMSVAVEAVWQLFLLWVGLVVYTGVARGTGPERRTAYRERVPGPEHTALSVRCGAVFGAEPSVPDT